MRGLLADVNCEGYVRFLTGFLLAESRRELWDGLSLRVFEFDDFGLQRSSTDRDVWLLWQNQELVLITGNRNARDNDSLEVVMRQLNEPQSLPIFTISNPRRVFADSRYANRIADVLLQTLYDITNYRGTGRLYLP